MELTNQLINRKASEVHYKNTLFIDNPSKPIQIDKNILQKLVSNLTFSHNMTSRLKNIIREICKGD